LRYRDWASSSRIERLFGIGAGYFLGWRGSELSAILEEQLQLPLAAWLKLNPLESESFGAMAVSRDGSRTKSLGDLLNEADPSVAHLQRAKDMAKFAASGAGNSPPRPVAMALYWSIIATAMCKCHSRITSLEDEELREGFLWTLDQSWILETMRDSVTIASELLGSNT
jgi:hypothetical protein